MNIIRIVRSLFLASYDKTGKYHRNVPELWPYDTVIEFKDKTRGIKNKGTFNFVAGVEIGVPLLPNAGAKQVTSYGGLLGTQNPIPLSYYKTATNWAYVYINISASGGGLQLVANNSSSAANHPYDAWVLYEIA